MTFAKNFLLIYLLLKPFYLFSSGGMQIADIFLVLSFTSLILSVIFNKRTKKDFKEVVKSNQLFIFFIALTFIINCLYFIYFEEFRFLLSTVYFIFNLLAILAFTSFYKDKIFLQRVVNIFKFNLILQLAMFLTGIGSYYSADRYMGTFNDPNQFGYYILLSFFFIYVIKVILAKKEKSFPYLVYFTIALFLIIQSASTGILLGLGIFAILITLYHASDYLKLTYEKLRRIIYAIAIFIFALTPIALLAVNLNHNSREEINLLEDQVIIERTMEKFEKTDGDSDISLLEDRGYDIILKYPLYVLYGAGEGGYDRFVLATNNHGLEIHATFPSILFYYGIIPLAILLRWIYRKIKGCDPRIMIVYIALFIESFTLLNQRQALFWMLISLGAIGVGSMILTNKRPQGSVYATQK